MKNLISIIVLVFLVGCGGNGEYVVYKPDSQIDVNTVLIEANSEQIRLLQLRLDIVENDLALQGSENLVRAFNVKISLDELDALIEVNAIKIEELSNSVNIDLDYLVNHFNSEIEYIENKFDVILDGVLDELILLGHSIDDSSVIEIVYPCGAGNSQEILLNVDGTILAYFEDGVNRYLNVIEDGYFRTTDGFQCNFRILDGQVVE